MGLELKWLFSDQRLFLERGYLEKGETPEQRYQTICNTIVNIALRNSDSKESIKYSSGLKERFERYISNGWVSFATPILKNFGSVNNLPISCNHSILEDSLDSIYKGLHEIGMLAKHGAGTAVNFSDIRAEGSSISTGGKSNTVLDWIELYADMMSKTAQNSARRGFLTAYLSLDHPEIEEFLKIGTVEMNAEKQRFFQTITTAVIIPTGWRQSLKDGDKEKRKIFTKVLNNRKKTGFPYILDEENSNKGICQAYIDKGLKIRGSNICVTGDQRVVTDTGYRTAKDLYETQEPLILFNNSEAVMASPMQLIERNTDVYEVTLDNGMTHNITEYHKVKVKTGEKTFEDIECKNLKIDDNVFIQTNKGLFGNKNAPMEAFLLGLWQSDGSQTGNTINIDVWQNDFDLLETIQDYHNRLVEKYNYSKRYLNKGGSFIDVKVREGSHSKKRLASDFYTKILDFKKGFVPYWIWSADEETQWNYIKGLLYADGTVYRSKQTKKLKNEVIQINYVDINKKFIKELQLIFNNLGLKSSLRLMHKAQKRMLPDSGGNPKEYDSKESYRLIIGNLNSALEIERNTGFLTRKKVSVEDRIYRDNTKKAYKIVGIKYVGKEDVYCTSIEGSDNKHWICNGFVTHNCIEAGEYCDYEKTFACCLSAVNLYYWDEYKDDENFIFDMNLMLDCVIEEYIEKGSKLAGLEKAVKFATEHRAIGLGTTAFFTYLQRNSISFGSLQSYQKNYEIFSTLRRESDRASKWMAKHWGEPKMLEGYGERNTSRMAQAPKKSTTFIDGGTHLALSEGIEPHKSNYNEKKLAKIQVEFKNKELEKVLKSIDKNTEDVWKSIEKNNGSVQHLNFLSEHEKNVFKVFSEVSQIDVIKLACQRQQFIDMSQSINIMVHPDTPAKDVVKLHLMAFDEGLKSLYYQYSINAAQKFSQDLLTCSSCEG